VGIEQGILPGCGSAVGSEAESEAKSEVREGNPRYEAINREQLCWRHVDVERLIEAEHPARAVWEFVGKLDLRGYQEEAWATGVGPAVTDQPVGLCLQRRSGIGAKD